ncbi:MAG: hypothetical protein JO222_01585 [Frankiales bacterium]|nr:hypothetical protein [Frankiales bacterium]
MAESSARFVPDARQGSVESLPRCCASHSDWTTLSEHLLREFPQLPIGDLLREVGAAKVAAMSVGLEAQDALEVGELIARHQLLILVGERPDGARLDPERHVRAS